MSCITEGRQLFFSRRIMFGILFVVALAGIWGGSGMAEAKALAEPETGEMRSALKFLQDLDNYYAAHTRPRSDRVRREDDMASTLMKLSQIKQHYSNVGRPRFGKRGNAPIEMVDEDYPTQLDSVYNWRTR